jgi:hypothetical protein
MGHQLTQIYNEFDGAIAQLWVGIFKNLARTLNSKLLR